jgi:putative hydrolase of the HAD superfamily
MLDKARLAARGELSEDYAAMRGRGFDGRLCRYLEVPYASVAKWAEKCENDMAVAEKCFAHGRDLSDEAKLIWNSFVSKRGWRDDETAEFIPAVTEEYGIDDDGSLQTDFDLIECDEGRPLDAWAEAWTPPLPRLPYPAPVQRQANIFRRHAQPLFPISTNESPQLEPLEGIRAVIFDVYGTLIISGSGDISLAAEENRDEPLRQALEAAGIGSLPVDVPLADRFHATIRRAQAERKQDGVSYPEVEIREVWTEFLAELAVDGLSFPRPSKAGIEALAIDYENRVNPVWPMPHLVETLAALRSQELLLGIVSNAQFYTRMMFPAFLGQPLSALGFALDCTVWSYQEREGKPSTKLYEILVERLAAREIRPENALYVGNDLRNDIWPAARLGLRTALFAADQRSLRWRRDDARLKDVRPDRILTDLFQLPRLLSGGSKTQ